MIEHLWRPETGITETEEVVVARFPEWRERALVTALRESTINH